MRGKTACQTAVVIVEQGHGCVCVSVCVRACALPRSSVSRGMQTFSQQFPNYKQACYHVRHSSRYK